jgi:hypothetical protein
VSLGRVGGVQDEGFEFLRNPVKLQDCITSLMDEEYKTRTGDDCVDLKVQCSQPLSPERARMTPTSPPPSRPY